jgi:hypothetical protein
MNFGERRVIQGERFLTHSERKIAQPARLLWAIQRVFVSKVCQKKRPFMANYAHLMRDHAQSLFDSRIASGSAPKAEEQPFRNPCRWRGSNPHDLAVTGF